ncbi:MAG: ankyrin repeat domain-containing protein [Pseudomonadota bacterium]|nr:ankyrin repeat domain-containing protein [Pseudomonadota bacterium]
MTVKKHTPEQWDRINAFIKKAKAEKRVPESYWAHVLCEINLTGWEGFANLKAEFMSINPVVQIKYLLTCETPEVKPNGSMRNCASCALIEIAKLGQVKRGQGVIKDLGADVNYLDAEGHTPLYYAIRRKRLGMAEMLLQNGADMYRKGRDSMDPFNLACAMGFSQGISMFIKHGADINHPTPFKSWRKFYLGYQTFYAYPLAIAVSQNNPNAAQTLLDNGADMDLKIRPDLTIRDFMEAHLEDMPQKMQRVVKDALTGEKIEVLTPEVLPPESTIPPPVKTEAVHVDSITVNIQVDLTPQKVAGKSQPTFTPDTARTHD